MLEKIRRLPAGTFLVPMIFSMIVYTIWPNLFMVGGMTQSLFSGEGVGFLAAVMTFFSGTLIDLKQIGKLLKRQGVLFISKVLFSTTLSLLYMTLFGQEGILGISSLAFVTAITSVNTAIYLLTAQQYGDELDTGAYGLFGILSLPVLPTIIYSFVFSASDGGIDWMPVLSILIPFGIGLVLGNLDRNFSKLFSPGIAALLPILGWNLGQGINLVEAVQAGVPGLFLTGFFVVASYFLVFLDSKVLKNDGLFGMSLITVAGLSTSVPAILAGTFQELQPYVASATAQVLLVCVTTSILAPVFIAKRHVRVNSGV